jgi:hypothetical protein
MRDGHDVPQHRRLRGRGPARKRFVAEGEADKRQAGLERSPTTEFTLLTRGAGGTLYYRSVGPTAHDLW